MRYHIGMYLTIFSIKWSTNNNFMMKIGMYHHFFSFFSNSFTFCFVFLFLAHSKRSLNPRVSLQQLYGLQSRSTLHITKITLKIMFLEQFTCTYTKVFRGFSFLVPPFFHTMASCSVAFAGLCWHQSTSFGGSPQSFEFVGTADCKK